MLQNRHEIEHLTLKTVREFLLVDILQHQSMGYNRHQMSFMHAKNFIH